MDNDNINKDSKDWNEKQKPSINDYTEKINFQIIDSGENSRDNEENTPTHGYMQRYEPEHREKPKRRGLFSYFVVALVAALIGGLMTSYVAPTYLYGRILPIPPIYQGGTNNTQPIQINPQDDINMVTAVAKKATGTVVEITTVETQNDFLWGQRDVQGVGSGVIVSSNGYILTNSHVVGDGKAKSITVQFEDGNKRNGQVLWTDSALDLSIVKVDATNLPTADLGDSDSLQTGEPVVAIGNPLGLGLQRTVTSGIISGLNRTIRVDQYNAIEDLIQTDASINPGNSGGPLLSSRGEVIGINTAKIQSAEGLGFAIPINLAKPIIEQVIKEGSFKSVYMGIVGVEVNDYEARLGIDLKADEGVIIIEVAPNSPAQASGIQVGDVLQKVDERKIEDMNGLKRILYGYNPGDKSTLSIMRNGQVMELEIIFVENPN